MGTRSRIAIRNADNTYSSVYCHWDGYPSHNGAILLKYYDTEEKVRKLLEGGDFSSLDPDQSQVEYYKEEGTEAEISKDLDELFYLTQQCGGEWCYVFTPAGWQCAKGGVSYFGWAANKKPEGLESVEYWIQRDVKE